MYSYKGRRPFRPDIKQILWNEGNIGENEKERVPANKEAWKEIERGK